MTGAATDLSAAEAQIGAADPGRNVWLVANAGSGKTRVLTDRVARLLMRGVNPQNILCLTYTKAAAAEMQNRLFRRLGEWAMADDARLRGNLAALGEGGALPATALARARQLFARAIETPGGIRIQTIHSFCAGILRRFPLEAGVSPAFTELDDRSAALLRAEILEQMAEGPGRPLLDAVLPEAGEKVDDLLATIAGKRADLAQVPDEAALRAALALPATLDEAALVDEVFGPGGAALLAESAAVLLRATGKTDPEAGQALSRLGPPGMAALEGLEGLFLYKTGDKAGQARVDRFPTKETRAAMGPLLDGLQAMMRRVEEARPRRRALQTLRKAQALHRFAAAFVARYEAAKAARGWLDFDDFILRASRLLTDRSVAPWVLFRLDGAIDHILVDEAQDTSPAQWQIIRALTEEFTAGEGAGEGRARSFFVVGDRKQSIYSFQGADVAGFEGVRRGFAEAFAGAQVPIDERLLLHSFRSSGAILSLVDHCFPGPLAEALGGAFEHRAFFGEMPGRVEIWPPVPKPEKPEPRAWFDPVDLVAETDAEVVLAERIAGAIRDMLDRGVQVPEDAAKGTFRAVRPGDFLILVQTRKALFTEIIRACKARGLPIAGADRLTLTEELAVRDILALLSFLNTPEDDLSLATVLRSPLFGWSEAQLYRLAHDRPGYLWERLRADPAAAETLAVLDDLRGRAEFLRPYELIERMLTRHGGRARLLGRLGMEAADAIDELMAQALAYERTEVPSLTGFLVWMAAGEVQVKRQAEGEGTVIRVMTVHGAKGLEAPVVILPQTADRRLDDRDMILPLGPGLATWAGRKDEDPAALTALKAARAADREAENLRLLYVAMTRAKCRLIVAAAGECSEASWYGIIRRGAEAAGALPTPGGGLLLVAGDWPGDADPGPGAESGAGGGAPADLPALPPASAAVAVRAASDLGGEKALSGEGPGNADALQRGTALHLLLEHLPGLAREERAGVAGRMGALAVLAEAEALLDDPALGWIFAPGTLAEVEVALPVAGGVIAGTIDRLVVAPERVVVVDYKSNAVVPATPGEVPEGYLRQLGAYGAAMAAVYPGRRIETAILWTRGRLLMPLDPEIVSAALLRAATP